MNPTTQPCTAAPEAATELPLGECAACIGLDWGDKAHAVALRTRGSGRVETLALEHSAESLHGWLAALGERFGGQRVAVAVEASKGAVVAALLEHPWLWIYPVHPATSRRFSTAFTPSGAKDDVPDARTLLEILTHHRARLRLLVAQDPATRRLGLLKEARRTVVDRRTLLSNQLTSLLKNYYPQALELTGQKRYAPLALAFLERWPELALLQQARAQTLRRFYHRHHVRRPELVEERLEIVRTARALSSDRALCEVSILEMRVLVAEMRLLEKHLAAMEAAMDAAFASHPEAWLFGNLPGAGAAMAPRLSVLFGTDRERWRSAGELQTYYGIAPVTEKSGRQKWVHWRWNAPVFARQTLVEWAGLSVKYSAWARAYYRQQEARQKGHSAILRSLAFKWLRILWRCWKDRTP
jgi:transposase